MNRICKTLTAATAVLALAVVPITAQAHGGGTPFENCPAAYAAGHSNIPEDSPHYGGHLDRDKDGVGCDRPPSDFVPADDTDDAKDDGSKDDSKTDRTEDTASDTSTGGEGNELAETGGNDATPYIAAGGAAVLLAGGALLIAVRRRRAAH